MNIFKTLKKIARAEKGASMLEYALTAALIAVVAIVAIKGVGEASAKPFDTVRGKMALTGWDPELPD